MLWEEFMRRSFGNGSFKKQSKVSVLDNFLVKLKGIPVWHISLSVCLQTKWLWVQIPLLLLKGIPVWHISLSVRLQTKWLWVQIPLLLLKGILLTITIVVISLKSNNPVIFLIFPIFNIL